MPNFDELRKKLREAKASAQGYPEHDPDQFLKDMSMIESSGGINTNHPEIKHGIHAGSSAVGEYGLMPNTVDEMIKRYKVLPEEYEGLSTEELRDKLTPDKEKEIATALAKHILNRQKGDLERSAYSWQYGHNLKPKDIPDEVLIGNDRVEKFKALRNKLTNRD